MDLQSKSDLGQVEKLNSQSQNQLVQGFPKEEDHLHYLPDVTKKDPSMLHVVAGTEKESKLYVFLVFSPLSLL